MTERMIEVLRVLEAEGERMTPNSIGNALGFRHGHLRPGQFTRQGRKLGAANRVNGSLTALRGLGFVQFGARLDGLSGTAYYITEAGRQALAEQKP